MKRVSRLQLGDIGKSFSVAFIGITVTWTLVSRYVLGGIYVNWHIFLGNLAVSGALAGFYYRLRYHPVLEYDVRHFVLRTGSRAVEGDWSDCPFISMYHKGFGVFTLRLYGKSPDTGPVVEIPVTDLGLDASDFRFEVMGYAGRTPAGD
jgi:hypothetical protein